MSEIPETEFLAGKTNKEDIQASRETYKEIVEDLRGKLSELSIETPEVLKEEVDYIDDKFSQEREALGLEKDLPPTFFIPLDNKEKVVEIFGEYGLDVSEVLGFGRAEYSIVFYDEAMSELDMASLVYHEKRHSMSYAKRSATGEGGSADFIMGGNITTLSGEQKGDLFEEGFVLYDTELYIHERLSKSMPKQYQDKMNNVVGNLSRDGGLKYSFMHETFLSEIPTGPGDTYSGINQGIDAYFMMNCMKAIHGEVPDFMKLVSEARLTGKWGKVARAVDGNFSKGTFQTLMNTPEDLSSVAEALVESRHSVESAKRALKELKS